MQDHHRNTMNKVEYGIEDIAQKTTIFISWVLQRAGRINNVY